ncbi:protein tyrosine phosphatase family protein [Ferrimonas futtsuensis]|uniref:protein tyrosine phosphatase family protein n=1 Tax=Ferrimonas futtsuensis TaxID=364764 RepID=UPI00047F8BBC|nr:protein tyrosine phosphatase family protein [Ferrimonas futtsuensis]
MIKKVVLGTLLASAGAHAAIQPEALAEVKAVQFPSERVITSGLPLPQQFPALKQAGVDLVINLIPAGNPTGLENEGKLVTEAGMEYAHIGVDWKQPTVKDVQQFLKVMDANEDKDVLIHCAANYRASAFYYLYLLHTGAEDSLALQGEAMAPWGNLSKSFMAYPQWQRLIEETKKSL